LEHCVAVIALNCEEPWEALSSFDKWRDILMKILEENMVNLPLAKQDSMRNNRILSY
jgi:hypothetical protein